MNVDKNLSINTVVLKKLNTMFQYFSSLKQILILDAYKELGMKRSKNELEKQINKL